MIDGVDANNDTRFGAGRAAGPRRLQMTGVVALNGDPNSGVRLPLL
jgi:hypothetical protein